MVDEFRENLVHSLLPIRVIDWSEALILPNFREY